ncbi:hypothetical protein DL93DRAFT_2103038 [Clavulina sp. PMI_390]|nr:hypothetical protein DL93DRAFT_2103038 [Clavulina sp. PMI_390]
MRPTFLISSLLLVSSASASWFSSEREYREASASPLPNLRASSPFDVTNLSSHSFLSTEPEYSSWNSAQLKAWLDEHSISVPKGYSQEELSKLVEANWYAGQAWSEKQVESAKEQYANVKTAAFDTWSESQLRDFLVKQGIVAPSGPREQLVLAANKQYRAYTSAASSLSAAASTAVYGDKMYQASKSVSSLSSAATSAAATASSVLTSVAAETAAAAQLKLDETKDYVYSTWSDNELRTWLEEKGVIKTKTQATRDELLAKMNEYYATAAGPTCRAINPSRKVLDGSIARCPSIEQQSVGYHLSHFLQVIL